MGAALKFKQSDVARQTGEVARLKVVHGPDKGAIFVIRGKRVSIGRGEENDVVLSDLRTSRKHCELSLINGKWSAQDAGSANGIAINGKATPSAAIKTRDTISLGETVIEFASIEAGTLMLVSPPTDLGQLEAEQANLDRQRARVQAMGLMGGLAKNKPRVDRLSSAVAPAPVAPSPLVGAPAGGVSGSSAGKQGINPLLLLGVGGVLIYCFVLPDPSGKKSPGPKAAQQEKVSTASDAKESPPDFGDGESVTKTADNFFREGFREYRLGNYLRAKQNFENVLQIVPDHRMAKTYLKNSENRIAEEVREHLDYGRKNLLAGKLTEARGDFETVMRLLFRDPENPAYIEAHDQLEIVRKQLDAGINQ